MPDATQTDQALTKAGGAAAARDAVFRTLPPEAADLLTLCAFYASDQIPFDLLIDGKASLPRRLRKALRDSRGLEACLSHLRLHCLADVGVAAFSVNAEVQAAARGRL
jgi:hypothetical protein